MLTRPAGSLSAQAVPLHNSTVAVALIPLQPESSSLETVHPVGLAPTQAADSVEVKPHYVIQPPSPPESEEVKQPGLISDYYEAKDLSRMPFALTDLDALQPGTIVSNVRGKLTVRLWLNQFGEIDRLAALESDLPNDIENVVLASFQKMRFKPGEINNTPVKVWVDIVIEYGESESQGSNFPTEIKTVTPLGAVE